MSGMEPWNRYATFYSWWERRIQVLEGRNAKGSRCGLYRYQLYGVGDLSCCWVTYRDGEGYGNVTNNHQSIETNESKHALWI